MAPRVPVAAIEASIPSLDDDPAERKRLQGVLAQRRYRQRKRAIQDGWKDKQYTMRARSSTPAGDLVSRDKQHFDAVHADVGRRQGSMQFEYSPTGGVTDLLSNNDDSVQFQMNARSDIFSFPIQCDEDAPPHADDVDLTSDSQYICDLSGAWTEDQHEGQQRTLAESEALGQAPVSVETVPSTVPRDVCRRSSSNSAFAFPDDSYISTPALSLCRAKITILTTIGSPGFKLETIWNAFAVSPFTAGTFAPNLDELHPNYAPTTIQLAIPHHPVVDVFPWPSVRDKLLQWMALPVPCRPPKLQGRTHEIVMQLKFDMMDAAGGIRIQGQDPFNPDNWEIGQRFFEEYWWMLDTHIIEQSNRLRIARHQDPLQLRPKT